jgi:hypothetical protein
MKAMFQKETARQPSVRGVQKRAGPSHPREGLRIWLLAQQNNRRDVPKSEETAPGLTTQILFRRTRTKTMTRITPMIPAGPRPQARL